MQFLIFATPLVLDDHDPSVTQPVVGCNPKENEMAYPSMAEAVVRFVMSVFPDEAGEIARRLIVATDSKSRQEDYTEEELKDFFRESRRCLDEQTEPWPPEE